MAVATPKWGDIKLYQNHLKLWSQGENEDRNYIVCTVEQVNLAMGEFLQRVTNETYNEWQDNSTTSNGWILNKANFTMCNAQVLLLLTKEFHH